MDSEVAFLVEVLGYRPVEADPQLVAMGARWYEVEDGTQVHLSADPDHQPAARAHVAIEYGPELAGLERRLDEVSISFESSERPGFPRVVNCRDPAGNLWELRGARVVS